MKTLYHYTLCPYSRKVRISLCEKKIKFTCELEKPWEKRDEFIKLNEFGTVPVLQEEDGTVISGSIAIDEYLEFAYQDVKLIGNTQEEMNNVRKYVSFFDQKFYADVTKNLVFEKYLKRYYDKYSFPNSVSIREGLKNLNDSFEYISWLVDSKEWIAGDFFSLADISAAAHISVIDYVGEVPWEKFPEVKIWYLKIKSRPSFRKILEDRVFSITPSSSYDKLDF